MSLLSNSYDNSDERRGRVGPKAEKRARIIDKDVWG